MTEYRGIDEPGLDVSHGVILYLEDLSVSFDGFKALNALSLTVDAGELRCIIGPNGAGKTTLMDVITGKTRPDSGSAWFGQQIDLLTRSEHEIVELGISRKFQKPSVFERHTVAGNLSLAWRPPQGASGKSVWATLRHQQSGEERDAIAALADEIGLLDHLEAPAGKLSHGQKQWLEIGLLLAQQPKLLLVDEPVAGMTQQEIYRTAELLTRLAGDRSVVVVEHDMAFIRSIAQKVTVLHEGSVLAEGAMASLQEDDHVRRVYLGESG
ncbi:MAG: urea ABC transporter ATP-binding protein UrtD [Pseudomonadota bacterium]